LVHAWQVGRCGFLLRKGRSSKYRGKAGGYFADELAP
jgi:hypothetical protein